MICRLFILNIIIVNFSPLFAAKEGFLDIEQYKIHPNWSMGCNNLGQCVAIGYPNAEENNEQKWYIKVEWNNDKKDDGNFLFSFFYTISKRNN